MSAAPPSEMPPMVQIGSPIGGRGPAILKIAWSLMAIATILLIGRVYLRIKNGNKERFHEIALYFTLISWATALISAIFVTIAVNHGMGNHIRYLSLPNIIVANKYGTVASAAMATFSAGLSKAAVAAFLLAMQRGTALHKGWAGLLYFVSASNIVVNTLVAFVLIFACVPVEAGYNPTVQGNCYSRDHLNGPVGIFGTCWNSTSDFILAVYPCLLVWKLHVAMRIKVFLIGIMGLGVVAGALGAVKIEPLYHVAYGPLTDPTYQVSGILLWGQLELWVVLIALGVPPIWPIVKPCLQGVRSKVTSKPSVNTGSMPPASKEYPYRQMESQTANDGQGYNMSTISSERKFHLNGKHDAGGIKSTRDIVVTHEDLYPLTTNAAFVDKKESRNRMNMV